MSPPNPSLWKKLAASTTKIGATKNGTSTSINGET